MLHQIVKAMGGGQIYANYSRANVPGLGHKPTDRSVSLMVGRGDKLVVHCHAEKDDWREVVKFLREKKLIDNDNKIVVDGICSTPVPPAPDDAAKQAAVERIWSKGQNVAGTLAERYIHRVRGIGRATPRREVCLFGSAVPLSAYATQPKHFQPALLIKLEDEQGRARGLEIHYLNANGELNTRLTIPRKTIGNYVEGWRCQIDEDAEEMVLATGFFSTLSASRVFDLPAVSLLGDKNMRHWRPKPITRRLVIAADNDQPCLSAAAQLMANLQPYRHLHVTIEVPKYARNDFNDYERDLRNGQIPH